MEGFWSVHFTGMQGFGVGVLTLIGGQVFGGDSGYIYQGTYEREGSVVTAHIAVAPVRPGVKSATGHQRFLLDVSGTQDAGRATLIGVIPGTMNKITVTLSKLSDLPPRK